MKPLIRTYSPVASIFVAFTLAGAQSAHAANDVWIGNTDANFGTLSNWTGSVTPNGNTPVFGVAGTSGTTLNNDISGATYVGLTFNSGASAYTIGGNSFTLTGDIVNNSTSLQTINTAMTTTAARTFNAASGQLAVGGNFTGVGLTLSGANKITLGGTNAITTNGNFGNLTINGAGGVDITGSTTLTGSAGNTFSGFLGVSNSAVAIKTGGSLTINGTTNASHPNSTVNGSVISVEGGSFTVGAGTGFILGNSGATTGTLTVTSGTVTINAGTTTDNGADTRFFAMGRDNASATGVINLNGGTIASSRAFARDTSSAAGAGTANFVFGGGTLKALANQSDWLLSATSGLNANALALSSVTTTSAASTIDANGFSVGINNAISGSGGFNINSSTGTGTVTFGGANTYTGATVISAGTFALASTGSIASTQITNASGATFDVSAVSGYTVASGVTLTNNGTVNGSFTVASGGTLNGSGTFNGAVAVNGALNPGNSPGSQTYASGLTLGAASTTTMEIAGLGGVAGTDFDFINVTGGTLTNDGSLAIVDFGGFDISAQTGTYNLFDFVAGAGDFDVVSVDGNSLTYNVGTDDWSATSGLVTYNFAEGNGVLSVTVVPEPTAALLGGLGLLGLLRRRRVA
jgi:MYXO-CTERM domain-containing protein